MQTVQKWRRPSLTIFSWTLFLWSFINSKKFMPWVMRWKIKYSIIKIFSMLYLSIISYSCFYLSANWNTVGMKFLAMIVCKPPIIWYNDYPLTFIKKCIIIVSSCPRYYLPWLRTSMWDIQETSMCNNHFCMQVFIQQCMKMLDDEYCNKSKIL